MKTNSADDGSRIPKPLPSEFTLLLLVFVTAFCNVSVFYSFYHYLETIGIPAAWRGFLVGLEPMAAFALRLLVLPWLHLRNAYGMVMASLAMLILVSCAYPFVTTVEGLILLRVFHGMTFVLLTSALIALMVIFIPAERSGQGFSIVSIGSMIPYALIPPLTEILLPHLRNAADIYAGVSVFSVGALLIMAAVRRRITDALKGMDAAMMRRPTLAEIRENFKVRAVPMLLAALLFAYFAHATFFYFMKNLTLQIGTGNVGTFFAVSMAATIAVRLFGARLFDRTEKAGLARLCQIGLCLCLALLPHVRTPLGYYLLAVVYGAGMGVVMPLLNALLFSASPAALRGLNTNLGIFIMDAVYFLTPYLGGALIASGARFGALFSIAAVCVMLSFFMILTLKRGEENF